MISDLRAGERAHAQSSTSTRADDSESKDLGWSKPGVSKVVGAPRQTDATLELRVRTRERHNQGEQTTQFSQNN